MKYWVIDNALNILDDEGKIVAEIGTFENHQSALRHRIELELYLPTCLLEAELPYAEQLAERVKQHWLESHRTLMSTDDLRAAIRQLGISGDINSLSKEEMNMFFVNVRDQGLESAKKSLEERVKPGTQRADPEACDEDEAPAAPEKHIIKIKVVPVDAPSAQRVVEPPRPMWAEALTQAGPLRAPSLGVHEMIPEPTKGYVIDGQAKTIWTLISEGYPVFLHGQAGTGKSSMVEQFCAETRWPFTRIACNPELGVAQLIAKDQLKNGETRLAYGPITTAVMEGHVLLIDEVSTLDPAVAMCLQHLLEHNGYLTLEDGTIVKKHESFRFVFADNTDGTGDVSGLFQGTRPMNAAFRDRSSALFEIKYPDEEKIKSILKQRTTQDEETVDRLAKFATELQKAHEKGEITHGISMRRLLYTCHLMPFFSTAEEAISKTVTNYFQREDRSTVGEIAMRIFAKQKQVDELAKEVVDMLEGEEG